MLEREECEPQLQPNPSTPKPLRTVQLGWRRALENLRVYRGMEGEASPFEDVSFRSLFVNCK